jgi:hypothetical protein
MKPKRCSLCGREFSKTPALTKPPDFHKNPTNTLLNVGTVSQVVTFLLMAAIARVIFGNQPLPPAELKFLTGAFLVTGTVAGIGHLFDRWKGK